MSLSARLYFHVELRASTLNRLGCSPPIWVIISSVSPSLRYSWSASPERLSKGRTASVNLRPDLGVGLGRETTRDAMRAAAQMTTTDARMRRRRADVGGCAAGHGRSGPAPGSAEWVTCGVGSGATGAMNR